MWLAVYGSVIGVEQIFKPLAWIEYISVEGLGDFPPKKYHINSHFTCWKQDLKHFNVEHLNKE